MVQNEIKICILFVGAEITDYSMLSVQEAEAVQAREVAQEVGGEIHGTNAKKSEGRGGFEDLTDLQNDEFIVGPLSLCFPQRILKIVQYVY